MYTDPTIEEVEEGEERRGRKGKNGRYGEEILRQISILIKSIMPHDL
jgi:hypothetical protein